MSSPFLDTYVDNTEFALQRQIPLLDTGRIDGLRGIHSLCTTFRQRAVCLLLATGDSEPFQVGLMQSAAAYLYYLSTANEDAKVTSFARPFFDAVVGGYDDAARSIAEGSRTTWNPDYEYEDDFLYVWYLMQRFYLDASSESLLALLDRYAAVLEGTDDSRLELCHAYADHDAPSLHTTLIRFLDERNSQVDEMEARGALTDEHVAWVRPFALEGALHLKLADRAGLSLPSTYLHVPDVVRTPSSFDFDADAWRSIDFRPSSGRF